MLCTGEVPEGKQKAQVQTGEQPWSQQQRTDLYILRQPRILPGFFVSRKCWFLSLTHISVLFAKHLPGTWGLGEAGACSRAPPARHRALLIHCLRRVVFPACPAPPHVAPQSWHFVGEFSEGSHCIFIPMATLGFWKFASDFLCEVLCNCTWEDQDRS